MSMCAGAMPLHRLAQRIEQGGVPMSRSTLTDLFHLSASMLGPLSRHLLQCITAAEGEGHRPRTFVCLYA